MNQTEWPPEPQIAEEELLPEVCLGAPHDSDPAELVLLARTMSYCLVFSDRGDDIIGMTPEDLRASGWITDDLLRRWRELRGAGYVIKRTDDPEFGKWLDEWRK